MKKSQAYIILGLLLLITVSADAQRWKSRRYEAFVGLGTANSYGDIGGHISAANAYGLKDIQLNFTRPSLTFGARYKFNGTMAAKWSFSTGMLAGNDANSKNELTRDYSFKAIILESALSYEYYILSEVRTLPSGALYNKNGMINNIFDINLYLFGGFGAVYSTAKVTDYSTYDPFGNNQFKRFDSKGYLIQDIYWTEPNPPSIGLCFPLGIGVKYIWSNSISFGAEFGRRFTTFDYIDGYTSVYSESNDIYDFLTFSLIYKVPTDRMGRPVLKNTSKFRL